MKMDDKELFKNVLKWARHHCHDLWKEYIVQSSTEKRQHVARKILIEKVKKEPDTELLISPALKEKILNKEGVDLIRINNEYQDKKGLCKEKQETKIDNQEKSTDSAVDENEIFDVNLYDQLNREWNKFRWYSIPSIASKLGIHRNTVVYWRDFGIKVNGTNIRLKMIKRPFKWYSKGKWIIKFFLKTNVDVDLE
jgi:ribosomal protein S25